MEVRYQAHVGQQSARSSLGHAIDCRYFDDTRGRRQGWTDRCCRPQIKVMNRS
jgi:hypothetical protein